jgi:hypothetical protein
MLVHVPLETLRLPNDGFGDKQGQRRCLSDDGIARRYSFAARACAHILLADLIGEIVECLILAVAIANKSGSGEQAM